MVSDPEYNPQWLAGRVLVASPEMGDPNFHRTLIYLVEHNENGAFGFVINRPSDITLESIMQDKPLPESMKSIQIYNGGPVSTDRLLLCCFAEQEHSSQLACTTIGELEEADEYMKQEDVRVAGFLGCAGWGEGQLEKEIRQGSWFNTHLHLEMLNPKFSAGIWALAREEDDRWRRLIPYLPDDPMQN